MLPRGFAATRTFASVLLILFLVTTPAFALPSPEGRVFTRVSTFWSSLVRHVVSLWANDLLPAPGGTSGGGGSGTSLDPSGLRRPTG